MPYRQRVMTTATNAAMRDSLSTVPDIPLGLRKHLLSACQIQMPLIPGTPFYRQLTHIELRTPVSLVLEGMKYHMWTISFEEYLRSFCDLVTDPIIASVCSTFIRCAPLIPEDARQEISTGIEKELQASVRVYKPIGFDFRVIFDIQPKYREKQLAPNLPPDYDTATSVHQQFMQARRLISGSTFWSSMGRKTVGVRVATEF